MKAFIYRHRLELIILIFGFFYMLFFSSYGLDIEDEGWFLYASKLISKGVMPYKDFSLHTTPGSLFIQALIFRLFSPTVMVGRYSMICLGLFIALILFYLNREIVSSKYTALISSIIFIFWGIPHIRYPWYGWYALAFGIIVPCFSLGYLKYRKKVYLFLTGVFCGLTFLMKQNIGTAVICATFLFFIVNKVSLGEGLGQKIIRFIKEVLILCLGIIIPLCVTAIYFYLNGALGTMLYHIFKLASQDAWNRFIFIPFPHVKSSSLFILFIYLVFCYLLYAYIWKKKRLFYGFFVLLIFISAIVMGFLFIKRIDFVDSIYILNHLKTGFINGFFNLCMLSVIFSGYVFLRKMFRKDKIEYNDEAILLFTVFSIFYIWSSLCVSRDHLHLVLGMVPTYVLIPFLLEGGSNNFFSMLKNKGKDVTIARRYTKFLIIYLPVLFISFIGFFSALKNEGFRSIFPPVTKMDSVLNIKNSRGIRISEKDNKMITSIVEYISQNTSKGEKIFDTNKSTLFYFLSDRDRPSFHLVMTSDVMRPDEQKEVIERIEKSNVKLVITETLQWDNYEHFVDSKINPLTYKIWRYVRYNFRIAKNFDKFYILERKP